MIGLIVLYLQPKRSITWHVSEMGMAIPEQGLYMRNTRGPEAAYTMKRRLYEIVGDRLGYSTDHVRRAINRMLRKGSNG
jgi:hypothetical protein